MTPDRYGFILTCTGLVSCYNNDSLYVAATQLMVHELLLL